MTIDLGHLDADRESHLRVDGGGPDARSSPWRFPPPKVAGGGDLPLADCRGCEYKSGGNALSAVRSARLRYRRQPDARDARLAHDSVAIATSLLSLIEDHDRIVRAARPPPIVHRPAWVREQSSRVTVASCRTVERLGAVGSRCQLGIRSRRALFAGHQQEAQLRVASSI